MDLSNFPVDVLLYVINIVVLFVLLRLILYKPVAKFMRAREERIAASLAAAESARQEVETANAKAQQLLADARAQAADLIAQETAEANRLAKDIRDTADDSARQLLQESRKEAVREREQALSNAQRNIGDLALQISARILEREVSAQDNAAIIDAFFQEVTEA